MSSPASHTHTFTSLELLDDMLSCVLVYIAAKMLHAQKPMEVEMEQTRVGEGGAGQGVEQKLYDSTANVSVSLSWNTADVYATVQQAAKQTTIGCIRSCAWSMSK